MAGKKGGGRGGKPKTKGAKGKKGQTKGGQQSQSRIIHLPVHLPPDELAEVFQVLIIDPLAPVSSQTAESTLPGLKPADRQKVLATAPAIIAGYESQMGELMGQYHTLSGRLDPLHQACEDEHDRLVEVGPPKLMKFHLRGGGPRERALMRVALDLEKRIMFHAGAALFAFDRIDELESLLREAAGGNAGLLTTHSDLFDYRANASLNSAEVCETNATIRRIESQLWGQGVKIVAATEEAARYRFYMAVDPRMTALCGGLTRLATRTREKREMELEMVELIDQAVAIKEKLARARSEYETVRAEEEGA